MEILIKNKRYLHSAAKQLLKYSGNSKLLAFYGAMGAGKTTIIKEVCEVLGVVDIVTSPTFTLVNEYKTTEGESVFHIDFYRIRKIEEVYDFGIEEYLTGDNYCLMEWPELIEDLLPAETIKIKITVCSEDERILQLL